MTMPLSDLPTEERNPRTLEVDTMPTLEVLRLINAEDERVAAAVAEVLPQVAQVVDQAVDRVHRFGQEHECTATVFARRGSPDSGSSVYIPRAWLITAYGEPSDRAR